MWEKALLLRWTMELGDALVILDDKKARRIAARWAFGWLGRSEFSCAQSKAELYLPSRQSSRRFSSEASD